MTARQIQSFLPRLGGIRLPFVLGWADREQLRYIPGTQPVGEWKNFGRYNRSPPKGGIIPAKGWYHAATTGLSRGTSEPP